MAERDDRVREGRDRLGTWIEEQVTGYWPEAVSDYRGRGPNGDHFWQIRVPTVGNFFLATTESVLTDSDDLDLAKEELDRARWLDRLPAVETHGILVKDGGRIFKWIPDKDETAGHLA